MNARVLFRMRGVLFRMHGVRFSGLSRPIDLDVDHRPWMSWFAGPITNLLLGHYRNGERRGAKDPALQGGE